MLGCTGEAKWTRDQGTREQGTGDQGPGTRQWLWVGLREEGAACGGRGGISMVA